MNRFLERRLGVICISIILLNSLFAGGDEGRLYKSIVYAQTDVTATLHSEPYHFVAALRNSLEGQTAMVSVPSPSSWSPNPFSLVDPSLLEGAHFLYDQGFQDEASMSQAFPEGDYVYDVTRNYDAAATEYTQVVTFLGAPIPSEYPEISNETWSNGVLQLHPSEAVIYYQTSGGLGFHWNLVGGGGSGGGGSSGASGVLDLRGNLRFGESYSGSLRLVFTEDESSIEDSNADINTYYRNSTYSTFKAAEVRFSIQMTSAPDNFQVLEASFSGGGQSWDVTDILTNEIENNSLIYRVDGGELSDYSYHDQYGDLYVKYGNADGVFEVLTTYDLYEWESLLILPDPSHQVVPISFTAWAVRNFSSNELTDLTIWGLDQDPDHDGLLNIYEFAYGTDPKIPDNSATYAPTYTVAEYESGFRYFGITYRRNKMAQLNFSILHSLDLDAWSPLLASEITEDVSGLLAIEQVSVFSSISMSSLDSQFLQLSITDPNPEPIDFPVQSLVIIDATYGAEGSFNNVTEIIEDAVTNDSVSLEVNNSTMEGDPIFGVSKELAVQYSFEGVEASKTVEEGQTLTLP